MTWMRFSELDGKSIGVWGAGMETTSLARVLAASLPAATISVVVLEDDADASAFAPDAKIVGPADALDALAGCDVLVRSPSVSIYRPELAELARRGVVTATPTALWLAERGGDGVLGVTGTKGKSTIASLVAHLVRAAGRPVQLAGNIGRPALELLEHGDELAVVELSSYQIADLSCGPETALVANLYREHLDWHLTEEQYRNDKLRLLMLPGVKRCVLNATSAAVVAAPRACRESFAYGEPPGWRVTDGGIVRGGELVLGPQELPLLGPHNALNVCAALTALEALGVERPPLPEAFAGFSPLPHRLQIVHEADGVTWVDDSISTTPESALAAIASFPDCPIVLIGGGQDRGQNYDELGRALAARGARVLGLPDTGGRLVEAARTAGAADAVVVEGLLAAVARAASAPAPGTVVLLSPGAPSYNEYRNFQERGDHFAALARRG
jgi:UDP-N-acetylmuramoylalanine--D-glutamate ligase